MTAYFRQALLAGMILASPSLFAQDQLVREHHWADTPVLHASEGMADAPTTTILATTMVDWEDEGGTIVEYRLVHEIRRIGTESGVEDNNKVYLPLTDVKGIVAKKARAINPDGKVVNLAEDDFKIAEDEAKRRQYLYFAFSGVQVGGEIEYLIIFKREPASHGAREYLQFSNPVVRREVHLITPPYLQLGTKGYNGAPAMAYDSARSDVRHLWVAMENVEPRKSEPGATYATNAMQVAYKLDADINRRTRDWSSYVGATKLYHALFYPAVDAKLKKALHKLTGEARVDTCKDELSKVRALENMLKMNFNIVQGGPVTLRDPGSIISSRTMNNSGAMIMTALLLDELGIEHQVVVTSDRQDYRFDKDFESYLGLQREFIYFPGPDLYMSPSDAGLRLGFIPAEYMDNYGLFIRTVDVGGMRMGVGKVAYIKPLPADRSIQDIRAQVDLASTPGSAVIHLENSISGYDAQYVQPYYGTLDAANKEELLKNLVGFVTDGSISHSESLQGDGPNNLGLQPVVISVEANTSKFQEQAGSKTLFKIGELIGPQVEMYAEKERTQPVDDDHARRFQRVIDVTLPPGTRIENLSDLELDRHLVREGRELLKFKSTYALDGDHLTVSIMEFYELCRLPVEDFESYRSVVNAAADFNKVVLVLARD